MKNRSTGMGCLDAFVVLLQIVFIVLKLCGVIAWSWWWVLAPIWIYIIFILLVVIICAIVYYDKEEQNDLFLSRRQ